MRRAPSTSGSRSQSASVVHARAHWPALIERAHAGESTLSPGVTRQLIALVAGDGGADERRRAAAARLIGLSPRELDVARLVGRGAANAEIAAELHLSVATVKAHVSRLLVKLEAANRVQVALLVHEARDGQDGESLTSARPDGSSAAR